MACVKQIALLLTLTTLLVHAQASSDKSTPRVSLANPLFKNAFQNAFSQFTTHKLQSSSARQSADVQCVKLMTNITNNFLVYNKTLAAMFRYSGKDYNDLGRYEDCETHADFHYILASIPKSFPIPMYMGLCLPEICTTQDLTAFKPFLVSEFNNIIPVIFKGIKGFDLAKQLNTDDLTFEDAFIKNTKATSVNGGALLMILVGVIFISLVVASTIYHWHLLKDNVILQIEKQKVKDQLKRQGLPEEIEENTESPEKAVKKRKKRLTNCQIITQSFSIQNSTATLFRSRAKESSDEDDFQVLNGLRVITLAFVILGNTYFMILKGPLQNLEIIQEWMGSLTFAIVLQAELMVDIFFWMSAFLASYFLLINLQENEGRFSTSAFRIILNRVARILPVYMFVLGFFWKFLPLFGGDGPTFFYYNQMTECTKYWMWHLLFVNNLVPWQEHDTCMSWTWYLANDMQFFLMVPFLVNLYYKKRDYFYYTLVILMFFCKIIQIVIILMNSLSISYFTYSDEYWTIYYVKPYSRLPVYLVGVLAGCSYYSYKREDPENQRIAKVLEAIKYSNLRGLVSAVVGVVIMQLMVIFMQLINNAPNELGKELNLIYLILARPLFIIGFSMFFFPILVGSKVVGPIRRFLAHDFWVPFSRLSFTSYLSHGIFMLFREFNAERGQWACAFDAFLFFLAYLTFSFVFSMYLNIFIEIPIAALYYEIVSKPKSQDRDRFYHSQSAKSSLRSNSGDGGYDSDERIDKKKSSQAQKLLENALKKKKILSIEIPDDEDEYEDLDKGESKPKFDIQNEDAEEEEVEIKQPTKKQSKAAKNQKKSTILPIFE